MVKLNDDGTTETRQVFDNDGNHDDRRRGRSWFTIIEDVARADNDQLWFAYFEQMWWRRLENNVFAVVLMMKTNPWNLRQLFVDGPKNHHKDHDDQAVDDQA